MSRDETPGEPTDLDRGQLDEDDHDLLTFGEVGERLRLAVVAAAREVAQLTQTGPADDLARAEARLRDLRAAAQRNAAQPINDANFERFFGYPGKARRNLSE